MAHVIVRSIFENEVPDHVLKVGRRKYVSAKRKLKKLLRATTPYNFCKEVEMLWNMPEESVQKKFNKSRQQVYEIADEIFISLTGTISIRMFLDSLKRTPNFRIDGKGKRNAK